ncbi:hypothetical protein [Brachybacterium paraconglomeratum]|uniref:hypothetical protein n=1 Tax=Brachybacterium paraconglomeratum TaxID=173362 RepID=UPI003FD4A6CC
MTTMLPEDAMARHGAATGRNAATGTGGKPASGRPAVFVTMLALAALGVLVLLVVGPVLPMPLAVLGAAALMGVVGLAWWVAGPRL